MISGPHRSASGARRLGRRLHLAGAMLGLALSLPLAANLPPLPTADQPAQPFAAFDVALETLWQMVERAASEPQRRVVLRNATLGVLTFAEYVGPELHERSFRNQAIFCAKLQRPPAGMITLLASQLSATTRADLAAYDPRQFPSDELMSEVALDLNRLMFSATLTDTVESRSPSAANTADAWALAAQNRRALEAAFPDEIIRSQLLDKPRSAATLLVSVYLLRQETKKTVLFVSAWIEGQPVRGALGGKFVAEVKRIMAVARSN
jgi:hypothetical protein